VEVDAACMEAVVGAGGGGSHGGWSRGSVEDGGAAAAVEKGATTVDLEKGAAAIVEEVGGRILTSSPVSCTRGVRQTSRPMSSRHHR
jgi:hypothetical protein